MQLNIHNPSSNSSQQLLLRSNRNIFQKINDILNHSPINKFIRLIFQYQSTLFSPRVTGYRFIITIKLIALDQFQHIQLEIASKTLTTILFTTIRLGWSRVPRLRRAGGTAASSRSDRSTLPDLRTEMWRRTFQRSWPGDPLSWSQE